MKPAFLLPILPLVLSGCTETESAVKKVPSPTKTPAPITTTSAVSADISTTRSPDGRFEATATLLRTPTFHGSVQIKDTQTKQSIAFWNNPGGVTGLSFSPDATLLSVNSPGSVSVWKWRAKKRLYAHTFDTGGGQYRIQSAFPPDGKHLAVTFGNLIVLNVSSWKVRHFPRLGDPAFVDDATWSPNSRFIALSQHDLVAFSLVDIQTGRVGGLGGLDFINPPIFSPDNRLLAGGTETGTFVWSVKDGARIPLGGDYEHPLLPVTFSPESRFIICRDEKGRLGVWRTRDGKWLLAPLKTSLSFPQLFAKAATVQSTPH